MILNHYRSNFLLVEQMTNTSGCLKLRARGRLIYASACARRFSRPASHFPELAVSGYCFCPGLAGMCKNRIESFWYSVLAERIYISTSLLIELIKLFNMTILTLLQPLWGSALHFLRAYSPSHMVRIANILTIS